MLLSGLVFPGLGQMVSGHPLRGLAYGVGSLVVAVALVHRVAVEAFRRIPADPTQIDPFLPFRLAREIRQDNATFFFWITVALLALWGGSVVDAWLTGRRRH